MDIRLGTYMDARPDNIVMEEDLPYGYTLVVFQQREGGSIAYIFPPDSGGNAGLLFSVQNAAELLLEGDTSVQILKPAFAGAAEDAASLARDL